MSDAITELNLKRLGMEAGEMPEATQAMPREEIVGDEDKVTLGTASVEEQEAPGSLTSLEQELLTLEAQPQEVPQMLSSDAPGALLEPSSAAEHDTEQADQDTEADALPGQEAAGALQVNAIEFPALALQSGGYMAGEYAPHNGQQVKVEEGGRQGEEGTGHSMPVRQEGAGQKRTAEGMGLDRQNTSESLGRLMEGGREGEDTGTEGEEHEGRGQGNKKQRLVWTAELHSRFMNAVNHLGVKNAVPKTILQLMNVEGMTRENVASHLQKYRLYLKRLAGLPPNARLSPELVQGSSHLYPYVHQPHEVPPPMIMPPQPVHQGYPPPGTPYYPPPHRGDPSGGPILGTPPPPTADASPAGPKLGETRTSDAGAPSYPVPVGTIPPSPPHFGYTPEMYNNSFGSMAHGSWHPLHGPGPGQPPTQQYRAPDTLPGSPVPQGQTAQYSPGVGQYSAPVGGSMYGSGPGAVTGVGSPAALQGSPYGYPGATGTQYGNPAAVGSPGGGGSPPAAARGTAPGMPQYSNPAWQQEGSSGTGFQQQYWMQPAAQEWQKRWPDGGPAQRKW